MVLFRKDTKALDKIKQGRYSPQDKADFLKSLKEEKWTTKDLLWMITHRDIDLREEAFQLISLDKSPQKIKLIQKEMPGKTFEEKKLFARALATCPPNFLINHLRIFISSTDKEERYLASLTLTYSSAVYELIDIFEEALADPDEEIRFQSVTKLVDYVRYGKIFHLLISRLEDPSDRVRHQIIKNFASLESPGIIKPFFERLPKENEVCRKIITQTLFRLAKIPKMNMGKYIIPILLSEEKISRNTAAQLLTQLPNKKNILREFLTYCRGVSHWVKEQAYESFATISESLSNEILPLMNDPSEAICIESIFLATYLQDHRMVPHVIHLLDRDVGWWIKVSAIEVLSNYNTSQVTQTFFTHKDNDELKWVIIGAIARQQNKDALPILREYLQDISVGIRLEAARALFSFKCREVIDILQEAAELDDPEIKEEIYQISQQRGYNIVVPGRVKKQTQEEILQELKDFGLEMAREQDSWMSESDTGIMSELSHFSESIPPIQVRSLESNKNFETKRRSTEKLKIGTERIKKTTREVTQHLERKSIITKQYSLPAKEKDNITKSYPKASSSLLDGDENLPPDQYPRNSGSLLAQENTPSEEYPKASSSLLDGGENLPSPEYPQNSGSLLAQENVSPEEYPKPSSVSGGEDLPSDEYLRKSFSLLDSSPEEASEMEIPRRITTKRLKTQKEFHAAFKAIFAEKAEADQAKNDSAENNPNETNQEEDSPEENPTQNHSTTKQTEDSLQYIPETPENSNIIDSPEADPPIKPINKTDQIPIIKRIRPSTGKRTKKSLEIAQAEQETVENQIFGESENKNDEEKTHPETESAENTENTQAPPTPENKFLSAFGDIIKPENDR